MKTFPYIQDSGHGWVRVPRQEIERLGIEKDITTYSYQKGRNVFLEEDCDMQILVDARTAEGKETKFAPYQNKSRQSRIRKYESYRPEGWTAKDYAEYRDNRLNGTQSSEEISAEAVSSVPESIAA
jgi:hypothetical protein